MTHAIRIHKTGGSDVLKWEEYNPGAPGPGEALIRQEAVGLNYIDVYHRTGLYPLPQLPAILGMEGAGIVEAVGEGVSGLASGDRVAYAGVPPGAYAEKRRIPAHRLVKVPEAISLRDAAGMMLQGMTARYLLKGCYPVGKSTTLLIHAAAGGVGTLVCQWAKALGATVIGTVGSPEKAEAASANGCDHPILYTDAGWERQVRDITDNRGVDVVYDSVGQATFMQSLDCLRPMGMMVSFGQSSGPIAPMDFSILGQKGSLFLTRPSLMTYTEKRKDLQDHARDLFQMVTNGVVRIHIGQTYALKDAAQAHNDLEGRKTRGSTILIVS
ncbi:MAG: quinone oxidoreductase [Desulfobacteraceae bacterium]